MSGAGSNYDPSVSLGKSRLFLPFFIESPNPTLPLFDVNGAVAPICDDIWTSGAPGGGSGGDWSDCAGCCPQDWHSR
jgi:hypothetical protein